MRRLLVICEKLDLRKRYATDPAASRVSEFPVVRVGIRDGRRLLSMRLGQRRRNDRVRERMHHSVSPDTIGVHELFVAAWVGTDNKPLLVLIRVTQKASVGDSLATLFAFSRFWCSIG